MGKSFSFELDISACVAQLEALRSASKEGARDAVDKGGDVLRRFIQAAASHGTTGALRASVTKFAVSPYGSGGWQVRVGPTVDYAKIREFGGSITAKKVSRLKFTSDGKVRFPRTVHQRGTHYIEAGARAAQDPIRDVMISVLDSVVEGAG